MLSQSVFDSYIYHNRRVLSEIEDPKWLLSGTAIQTVLDKFRLISTIVNGIRHHCGVAFCLIQKAISSFAIKHDLIKMFGNHIVATPRGGHNKNSNN